MSPAKAAADYPALAAVADTLACPVCGLGLHLVERSLRCARGHSHDIARQGYITLLTGATKITGDTAAMLDARAAFQRGGYFAPIAQALTTSLGDGEAGSLTRPGGVIAEIGVGTGYYLTEVLRALPWVHGIGLDISKAAAKRCARVHQRMAAVVADAWRGLPVRPGALAAACSVFAPRNPTALAAALRSDGRYVIVTPTQRHLGELIEPLGMVRVDPEKQRRLDQAMAGHFTLIDQTAIEYPMALDQTAIADIVAMGPSAHHTNRTNREELPEHLAVTASVLIRTYQPAARGNSHDE